MRSTWLILATCTACSFGGSDGPSDGPAADEKELLLDSAETFNDGSPVSANVSISAAGTVEPKAWWPGQLLVEISGGNVNFGSWADKPARAQLVNVGVMAPPFEGGQRPPGVVGSDYILWFSGDVRLDAGAQRLAVSAAAGADAFAEVLTSQGTALASCDTLTECAINAPEAGWYTLHMGWKHPITATSNVFELQWALGAGALDRISTDRLRVASSAPAMSGWRVEGHEFQRSISHLVHGTALNYKDPFKLLWGPGLLGLDGNGASPSYRNAGQLRVLEAGDYDFTVTAASEAAYRMWVDGDWVTKDTAWNPQPSGEKTETIKRTLSAGWHDVVLEGYEQGGTGNEVTFTLGKSGQSAAAPLARDARPLLSPTTQFATAVNPGSVQLVKGSPVPQTLTVSALAGAPSATAVDVWLRLTPRVWNGLDVKLKVPNSNTSIPLTISTAGLTDDTQGDVHASLTKAQLGDAPVSGAWTVEVTHPNNGGGLNGSNVLSRARLSVHYKGSATVGAAEKQIAETGSYARMVSLDASHELRGLIVSGAQPQGSSLTASLQICTDAAGASCEPALTAEQVAQDKPLAQHVKISVAFQSDGFAAPILDKLALRYKE